MEMLGIKSNIEMVVTGGYHYMQQLNPNSLFAIEPSKRGMAYQVTCAARHHSVLSRINYNSLIIKKDWQCKARRGRLTAYQSEDPSPHTTNL